MFDGNNLEKLRDGEVVRWTKQVMIIHITSKQRLCKILNLKGISAVQFDWKEYVYSCRGKVNVVFQSSG